MKARRTLVSRMHLFALLLAASFATRASADDKPQNAKKPPEWAAAMAKVHQGFSGEPGYVAQFGDSITYSLAFWSPIDWDDPAKYLPDDGLPKTPAGKQWKDVVRGARAKGSQHGNASGWRVQNVLKVIDEVLHREKPEVAIVMIGTNDISGGKVPKDFRENFETLIRKCLDAHCVPIVNTIPPRRKHDEAVAELNAIVRDVAKKQSLPLVDYHAAIVERRPKDWDGTLISKDGVHPSGGKNNVYTEENLKESGYALRNWLNFLALRQVHFHVLNPESAKPKRK